MGQKLLTWIRQILICYIVPWWLSWLSDQIAFNNSESDVVWRVSRLPPWHHLGYWNWMIQQFWISISPRCLPSSFGSTWLTVWEEMWFEEFQDGGHLGHWNRRILSILNFHITPMPPIMFKLNQTYPLVQMWFQDFQDGCHGGHLGYQNGIILAILNLHAAPMPSIKFLLHPTYCSGADNNWRLTR